VSGAEWKEVDQRIQGWRAAFKNLVRWKPETKEKPRCSSLEAYKVPALHCNTIFFILSTLQFALV